uniref:DEMETER-like protein 3 n=1 Tax=Noccaea caerulescens TaxID=107243 RepID=A0A1J3IJ88_NOCCA
MVARVWRTSVVHPEEENKNPKEEVGNKCDKSKIPQGKGKRKNSKEIPKKQRFHRPRIIEDTKKRKNEKDNEEVTIVEPRIPPKQSFPKRRKTEA